MKDQVRKIVLKGLDQQSEAIQSARKAIRRPAHGWLGAVRESMGLSQSDVAAKLGVTRQAYAKMEASEERGAIGLKSLDRAAEAMGCEVTYFLSPRSPAVRAFSELSQRQNAKHRQLAATEHSMLLEGQAIGDLTPRRTP